VSSSSGVGIGDGLAWVGFAAGFAAGSNRLKFGNSDIGKTLRENS